MNVNNKQFKNRLHKDFNYYTKISKVSQRFPIVLKV